MDRDIEIKTEYKDIPNLGFANSRRSPLPIIGLPPHHVLTIMQVCLSTSMAYYIFIFVANLVELDQVVFSPGMQTDSHTFSKYIPF